MLPIQVNAFVILHVRKIGRAEYATEDGSRDHLSGPERLIPRCGLAASIVHNAFVRVDGGIRYLAFDGHHATVPKPRDNIGTCARKPCLAAILARIWRRGQHRNVTRLHLFEVASGKQVFDRLFLIFLGSVAAVCSYLACCSQRRRCNDSRMLFLISRRSACADPGKAMRIKDGKNDVADMRGLCGIETKTGGSEIRSGNGLEVVGRYRRCGEIAEGFLGVPAVKQIRD